MTNEKKGWEGMRRKGFALMVIFLIVAAMTVASRPLPVQANASKEAVRFLKGKWGSNSMDVGGSAWYVTFGRKWARYYVNDGNGNYAQEKGWKRRILSTEKRGDGYRIRLEGGTIYQTQDGDPDGLSYYGDEADMIGSYSGSSSLHRGYR